MQSVKPRSGVRLTGGEAVVESIKRQGVEVVFGLPGVQLDWLFDALYRAQAEGALTVYHTRHEQATSYMADGYARVTGRPGTSVVVPGCGLLNAMTGLATAYSVNSPVRCITGQIPSELIEVGRGLLHEIPRQMEVVRSVAKWSGRALSPSEVPGVVAEAFRQMLTGRTRPVEIEIPPDVLQMTGEVELPERVMVERLEPDPDDLEEAARLLGRAERPLIVAGGGILASGAADELRELAEMLQAPVILTSSGKGALSYRHYLAQPALSGEELLPHADVVLLAGTRFIDFVTADAWKPSPSQTAIRIEIDPEEMARNYEPSLGILSDARLALGGLVDRVGRHNRARQSREEELRALKEWADDLYFEVQPQASYGMVLREEMPDDAIFVSESTQVAYWADRAFPVYEPRTYLTPGYQGALGYGYGTALGAQVGRPDRRVVSVNGDGGFMYNVQELATAVQHGINAIAVVFNDNAYGNVRRTQRLGFEGRIIATDLHNPDFLKLADSFGLAGLRAEGPEGLRSALREAFTIDGPVLIEVPVGEMPNIRATIAAARARR
jgi:acetolactate synthase-1/2/3 large subunit